MHKNIHITLIVDRQVALIIGAAIGVLMIGTIGVSAHAGPQPLLKLAGVHEPGDVASATRIEHREATEASPRPPSSTEKPEGTPAPKPSAKPTVTSQATTTPEPHKSPETSKPEKSEPEKSKPETSKPETSKPETSPKPASSPE